MRNSISPGVALFFLLVSMLPLRSADFLADARDRSAHGEYESAVAFFEKHLRSAPPSAAAYYELGQAFQKSDKEADAALAYRRSLLLDPRFAPASEALRETNAKLGVAAAVPSWQARLAEKIPADPTALAGAAAFWVGAFVLIAAFAIPKKRTPLLFAGIPFLLAGLAACLLVRLVDPRFTDASQAVVMDLAGAALYKVPSEDDSEKITTLNQGSTVKILSTRGRWLHSELPGGQRGWLLEDRATPVIPQT